MDERVTVQAFYDWYLEPDHDGRNVDIVLAERPQLLTNELRALLAADRKCVAESGEICKLEFDPFLNAQDYCGRYEAANGVPENGMMAVPVFATCEGRRDSLPRLTVILQRDSAGYRFADLVYDLNGTSLRRILSDSAGAR